MPAVDGGGARRVGAWAACLLGGVLLLAHLAQAAPAAREVVPPAGTRLAATSAAALSRRDALAALPRLDPAARRAARRAWEGFERGEAEPALAAVPVLRGTVLEPWIDFWALAPRLQQATQADVDAYARAWPKTLPQRLLRQRWLAELARRQDWAGFLQAYTARDDDDPQLQCMAAQARFSTGHVDTSAQVLALWRGQPAGGYGCNPAARALLQAGLIDRRQLWSRLQEFVAEGQLTQALYFAQWLGVPLEAQFRRAATDPLGLLLAWRDGGASLDARQQQLAQVALLVMARQDPQQAVQLLDGPRLRRLPATQRARVAWVAARSASARLLPQADALFRRARALAPNWQPDAEGWKWCLRAALRAADWRLVGVASSALLRSDAGNAEAIYWKAVALRRIGQVQQARRLWRGIAAPWSYYGQLASEALGQGLRLPAVRPRQPGAQALLEQARRVDVQRALLLSRIGAYAPAVAQWRMALGQADDAGLHAAAQLACDRQAWLLCIWASDRMQGGVDWKQRYVMPFRAEVAAASRGSGVSQALIYGIMRQESRFSANIRSSAGADGLMQLMPATARWVAGKIGRPSPPPRDLSDVGTNLTLGSAYLGMLLQRFGGSQAMAAASYNAGPLRIERWRSMDLPGRGTLDGAVFVESIPFAETRQYVKSVLANATVYAALLGARQQSLESRLALADAQGMSARQPMP